MGKAYHSGAAAAAAAAGKGENWQITSTAFVPQMKRPTGKEIKASERERERERLIVLNTQHAPERPNSGSRPQQTD